MTDSEIIQLIKETHCTKARCALHICNCNYDNDSNEHWVIYDRYNGLTSIVKKADSFEEAMAQLKVWWDSMNAFEEANKKLIENIVDQTDEELRSFLLTTDYKGVKVKEAALKELLWRAKEEQCAVTAAYFDKK